VVSDLQGRDVLIAVVSDGAGSAAHSDVGSRIICDVIHDQVVRFLSGVEEISTTQRVDINEWLLKAIEALESHATQESWAVRDLAGTCLICIAGCNHTVCVQVGDGAIVLNDGDGFVPALWPQRGEYANTTTFLYERSALADAQLIVLPRSDRVAVFSDGIQMVALDYTTQAAPATFWAPLFGFLEQQPSGSSDQLNLALAAWLDRKPILDRTDDDRTLVLASRRGS